MAKPDTLEKDMAAGKFSVEAPKKLYKGGMVESKLFPFRKALLDKICAKGVEFSIPDAIQGCTAGDKASGQTELTCGTKVIVIKGDDDKKPGNPIMSCNPKITYSEKTMSACVVQKEPGKLDVIYKTDVDKLMKLDGGKGMVKIEERKAGRDLVLGLGYTSKQKLVLDLKLHPLRVMAKNAEDKRADLKAACYYPVSKMVSLAGEFKSDLALPSVLNPKVNFGLAANTAGLTCGMWYRFDAGAGGSTVGANLYKKMEVAGKPAEAAVEVFSPLNSFGAFSWLAGAQLGLSKQWTLNAKMNHAMQLNLGLKCAPAKSFSLQCGTLLRIDDLGGLPNFGFKATMKM